MESGEVLHQSFSQAWASLNREAVEEAGKLGEVRDEKFFVAQFCPLSLQFFMLIAYFHHLPIDNVLDAIWRPEV